MLLRRVTKHVKDENWFAVGIDFCIVVIGVFIGIQVANWNEARSERSLRGEYLAQLTDDLRADIAEAGDTARIAWDRAGVIDDVFEAAGFETPLPELYYDGQLATAPPYPDFTSDYEYAHNHTLTYIGNLEVSRDTFDALVSNGHLELLENPDLVRQIQSYYRLLDTVGYMEDSIANGGIGLAQMRFRNGIPLTGRATLDDLAEAAKSDPEFVAHLDSHFMQSAVQASRMLEVQFTARALIDAIEEAR